MLSKGMSWTKGGFVLVLLLAVAFPGCTSATNEGNGGPECSDGIDNSGDALVDQDDPNCNFEGDITIYCPNWDSETIAPTLSECN